ncbi:MAG: FHA domain-containing protein, partial [Planctomycetota bacterium]|nr:FHA domain-containing protein [Planctomycetota bacterium]
MGEGSNGSEIILEILTGSNRGKKIRSEGEVIRIGSHPDSDMVFSGLESDRVALVHAKITNTSGRYILYDNEDEFATFHNDKRVDQADLESGDILQFGTDGPMVRFRVVGDTTSLEETKVWRKPEGLPFLPRFDS